MEKAREGTTKIPNKGFHPAMVLMNSSVTEEEIEDQVDVLPGSYLNENF